MKKLFFLFNIIIFLVVSNLSANSVVKIHASLSIPNYKYPWQTSQRSQVYGSGVIIQDNYIITNAHVISDAKFIQVSKDKSSKKYTASVKYISHQADLALLEVNDKTFFKNTIPLKFTEDIKTGDNITVLGYPIGGDTLSTTKGTTSRIEHHNYVWSYEWMLAIQIDAAINSGNSGGAALNDKNEIVGIVMQSYSKKKSDNIGYIIPTVIVKTFLEDIKDGKVDGFEDTKMLHQRFINEGLKSYYKIRKDNGVLLNTVKDNYNALKNGDIVLEIEDKKIANDGTIQTRYGTLPVRYLFHTKPVGETLKIKLLRAGKVMTTHYTLKRKYTPIKKEYNKEPRYIIFGGLSFTPMTTNYLWKHKQNSTMFNIYYEQNKEANKVTEAVTIQSEKFNHEINDGYRPYLYLVKSINGNKVLNFKHFVELLDDNQEKYTVIKFWDVNLEIVFETEKARESFEEIQNIYGVDEDRRVGNQKSSNIINILLL
jgi:S1-C subfamily serine protease